MKIYKFIKYIERFGYSEDKYYHEQRNGKIFVSTDGKKWSEGTSDDIKYMNYGSLCYTYDSVSFDGNTEYPINYESSPKYGAFSLNQAYISKSNYKIIALSRDIAPPIN